MQSEGSFPEEDRGRRPPPSTSPPCPTWFFRLRSPFFRGSKTAVQKRFAPLQLLALVQLAQKRPPDFQPNAPLLPVSQPPPAGRGMWEFLWQVLPASPRSAESTESLPAHDGSESSDDHPCVVWVVSVARARSSATALRSATHPIGPSALLRRC